MARPNHLGLLPFFLTVKPFAYVVRYYTCQNGKDKGNKTLHYVHLLPVASIGNGNKWIISYFSTKIYKLSISQTKFYDTNSLKKHKILTNRVQPPVLGKFEPLAKNEPSTVASVSQSESRFVRFYVFFRRSVKNNV